MKPNVVVALLLGLVIGFAVGKSIGGPGMSLHATAQTSDESSLAIKSSDFPPETFAGLNDTQKYAVMKVLNDNNCDCGCDKGSVANCAKTDPSCPKSPALLRRAVGLAKLGKTADQIQADLFPGKKPGAPSRPNVAGADDDKLYKVPLSDEPMMGPPDALVTIVEFSDYQCPFCGRAHQTLQQVLKEFDGKVRLQMRQFPLTSIHPHAMPAALAAVSTIDQGKFWEMHNILFEHQHDLDDASLEKWAQSAGVNVAKWKEELTSQKTKDVIARDQAAAAPLGVQGTPAFFINGRKIGGAKPVDAFRNVINSEYAKAEQMVKSGVKPGDVYAKILSGTPTVSDLTMVDVPADAPFFGPKDAKVTIVEFSDFQCPYCSRAVPAVKQIEEMYPKDVKIVFRQFPLGIHPFARLEAEAAAAAAEQGKFWPMHDKLFASQSALGQFDRAHPESLRPQLEKWGQEVGLDMKKWREAMDSGRAKAIVDSDLQAGSRYGVQGTPTFFIDGKKQLGAPPMDQAKTLIDGEIVKADKLLATGVKAKDLYPRIIASANDPGTRAPAPQMPNRVIAPSMRPQMRPVQQAGRPTP